MNYAYILMLSGIAGTALSISPWRKYLLKRIVTTWATLQLKLPTSTSRLVSITSVFIPFLWAKFGRGIIRSSKA